MEIKLLFEIVTVFSLSIAVIFLSHRFKVPVIVGFLFTGIIAGPHGLALIRSVHEVEMLAEIGVVLLLFTIGVEFSLRNLLQIKKLVLVGGALQVMLTIAAVFGVADLLGFSPREALFWGFLVSLSSTAIVLKILQERAEVDTPHGRAVLGILIFQDIIVVPMMLVTPVLAGRGFGDQGSLLLIAAKGVGLVAAAVVATKWVVPLILYQVAKTRNREVFLLTIVVICLAAAWLTQAVGLSLALGAFLAGLIISESEYNHQALGNILPFRDVFTSLFFVSIGMLLDVRFLVSHFLVVPAAVLGIVVVKAVGASWGILILRMPLRTAILTGMALGQVGEFSFILADTGVEHHLLDAAQQQMFLACSIVSMAAAPLFIALSPKIVDFSLRLPLPTRLKEGGAPPPGEADSGMRHHLIIVGFGINGRNVAKAAKLAGIPYVILEMNPETVRRQKEKGEPIHYGDAAQEAILDCVGAKAARVAVVAINDPAATRGITDAFKQINPRIHLIVRTRYLEEIGPLRKLGADEVIPEEFETSVEIFSRVLSRYLVPRDEIEKLVGEVRSEGYEMLRSLSGDTTDRLPLEVDLPDMEVGVLRMPGESRFEGRTVGEMELRRKHEVTVLAVRRGSEIISNPGAETALVSGDLLYVLGSPDRISRLDRRFRESENVTDQS